MIFNTLTPTEITKALRCCSNAGHADCINCPKKEKRGCAIELMREAADTIETLYKDTQKETIQ